MQKDKVIRRIIKIFDFYDETELSNYSREVLYYILKHSLFIDLKEKIKNTNKKLSKHPTNKTFQLGS